jgi:multidrug efflux pump
VTQVIEQNMTGARRPAVHVLDQRLGRQRLGHADLPAGTDPDIAQVQVQNKLQLATPLLPQAVQQQGVRSPRRSNFLMVVGFVLRGRQHGRAPTCRLRGLEHAGPLSAASMGVGDRCSAAQYAMRIWLDPAKLQATRLTPADVRAAIEAQNTQVSAGQLGGTPAVPGQQLHRHHHRAEPAADARRVRATSCCAQPTAARCA